MTLNVGDKVCDKDCEIGYVRSMNKLTFEIWYPLIRTTKTYSYGTSELTKMANDDIISVNGVGAPKKIPDIVSDIVSMLTREGEVDLAVHVLNYYKKTK